MQKTALIFLLILSACSTTPATLPMMTACSSDPTPTDPKRIAGMACSTEKPDGTATSAVRKPYSETKGYICFPPDQGQAFFDACGARIRAGQ